MSRLRKRFRPGVSFGDFVIKDSQSRKSRIEDDRGRDFRRGWLVWVMVIVGFGVVIVRLASLQVVYGQRNRLLSDENRVRTEKIRAARGRLLDRDGAVLADNVKESVIKDGEIVSGYLRVYPVPESTAHILGYLGEVTEDEVGLLKEAGSKYSVGDWVGRTGVEAVYEGILRGVDGGRLIEVDNLGGVSRELGRKEAIPGKDIYLSVDADLQEEALTTMEGKPGAVVVSIPQTGEILAMVSSPSYDPNLFVGRLDSIGQGKLQQVLVSQELPLFNRAIGGVYPPGSVFKMITTAAAVDSGQVRAGFTYEDRGVIRIGIYEYNNWLFTKTGGTEGVIGFIRALVRSTDTFFYEIGGETGPEIIKEWGEKFGLAGKTGIDLPGEVTGLMPDPEWKLENKSEKWFLGDTYIMSIGQGDILVTPAQINRMTNILATGGKKCELKLTQAGDANKECEEVEISNEAMRMIKEGMIGACSSGGTAFVFFDWNEAAKQSGSKSTFAQMQNDMELPVVACKTGTAEYMTESGKMRTHGWLTAFAPADNPEISVTVLMEGGGEGSNVAAPVVRKIMAKYFNVTDTYPYGSIRQEVSE